MASGIPGKANELEYHMGESHYGRHNSTKDSLSSRKMFMISGIPENCKPNNLKHFIINEAKQREIPIQMVRIYFEGHTAYASLVMLENNETAGKATTCQLLINCQFLDVVKRPIFNFGYNVKWKEWIGFEKVGVHFISAVR